MIILLNEDWRIDSDSHNWILQQRKVTGDDSKTPGQEYWVNEAFCGDLDTAFWKCAQLQLRFSDAVVGPDAIEPLLHSLDELKRAATGLSGVEKADD